MATSLGKKNSLASIISVRTSVPSRVIQFRYHSLRAPTCSVLPLTPCSHSLHSLAPLPYSPLSWNVNLISRDQQHCKMDNCTYAPQSCSLQGRMPPNPTTSGPYAHLPCTPSAPPSIPGQYAPRIPCSPIVYSPHGSPISYPERLCPSHLVFGAATCQYCRVLFPRLPSIPGRHFPCPPSNVERHSPTHIMLQGILRPFRLYRPLLHSDHHPRVWGGFRNIWHPCAALNRLF